MGLKKHIVVLMGGMSSEHEVSLNSGGMVVENLNPDTYKVTPVHITLEGEWDFGHTGNEYLEIHEAIPRLKKIHPDCVFIALHGPYGEDGRIQGMLDLLGIPYTGSGCTASAIAIDKIRAKELVSYHGLPVANHLVFDHLQWNEDADSVVASIVTEIGLPCVVKSPRQGSSLGMGIPQNEADLRQCVDEVLHYGLSFLVETFIEGTELTVSVLDVDEGARPVPLPVTEIRPVSHGFFDYHAKYTAGATEEITPATFDETIQRRAREIAVRAHEIVGCRGFSRSDMMLRGEELFWLEVNTIPGFTATSLYPQAAAAAGIEFPELLDRFIEAALL